MYLRLIIIDFLNFMNNLTVIARENCIYCRLAIRLLEEKGLQFELLMLGIDFEREELESFAPGARTFPQILVNGVSIGGYEDLLEKVDNIC